MKRSLVLFLGALGIANCNHIGGRSIHPAAAEFSLCDDLTSIVGESVSLRGYIWVGIPAIWDSECPKDPVPTLPIDSPSEREKLRRLIDMATNERDIELVVMANYVGVVSVNENGGYQFKISEINNAELVEHPHPG